MTPTPEPVTALIERVARAILLRRGVSWDVDATSEEKHAACEDARAAIAALNTETARSGLREALVAELAEVSDVAKGAYRREVQALKANKALTTALKQVKLKAILIADKDYSEPRLLKFQAEIREIIDAAIAHKDGVQ